MARLRILFTFVGGRGHFEPLVPIASAARTAGHTVSFGCAAAMLPLATGADFSALAIGSQLAVVPERTPLLPVDREREDRHFRDRFASRAARYRAPHIVALCKEWRPDILVCDETDFGAMLAAEQLGFPHATVLVNASGSQVRAEVVREPLDELRCEFGLAPDPDLEMLRRYLVLSPFPASFRDPLYPLPATAHAFRPFTIERLKSASPVHQLALPGAPTIYFTLGTIFNLESGDLFSRVLKAFDSLAVNVIATVGPHIDPAEFGSLPVHVHMEPYIAQLSVLPHCDAVVSHAGSGSVIGALAHGLPSVLIPMGADQPLNADRCIALGVARVLDALTVTPDGIRAAVETVLDDSGYRQKAERLRDEIAVLPDPTHALALLEQLAAENRPL